MKKKIVFLITVIVFNLIFPLSTYAKSVVTVYNRNRIVSFDYDVITNNDEYYVCINDIKKLNLGIRTIGNDFEISDDFHYMEFYIEDDEVCVDGRKVAYKSPSIIENDLRYVSLDLIAEYFSVYYHKNASSVELWIRRSGYDDNIAVGTVSLPTGRTAPEGGISVKVFVAYAKNSASSGGSGGSGSGTSDFEANGFSAGYIGGELPDFERQIERTQAAEYSIIASTNIVIEQGKNSKDFYITSNISFTNDCVVGYTVDYDGTKVTETLNYDKYQESYKFILKEYKNVSGSILLPNPCTEDNSFDIIITDYNNYYKTSVTISEGEVSAPYSLYVKSGEGYAAYVLPQNKKYERVDAQEIDIYDDTNDLSISYADTVPVTLTLPNGEAAADNINIEVVLQNTSNHSIIDREMVTIPKGESEASVILYDIYQEKGCIVWYILCGTYDGYYNFGHYGLDGTVCEAEKAYEIYRTNGIQIPLLKSKKVSVNINRPNNGTDIFAVYGFLTANVVKMNDSGNMAIVNGNDLVNNENEEVNELDLTGDGGYVIADNSPIVIYDDTEINLPLINYGSFGIVSDYNLRSGVSSITPMTMLIESGKSSGVATVTVPDIAGYKYCFKLSGISPSMYTDALYYTKNGGTVFEAIADLATKDDDISFTLMRSYTLCGEIKGFDDSENRVYLLYRSRITGNWINFDKTTIYGDGEYEFNVPDEVDEYIVSAKLGEKTYYYCSDGLTENINEAEILTVNDDINGINFIFLDGIPQITVKASMNVSVDQIEATITSKYNEDNLSVLLAYFNRFGEMIDIKSRTNVSSPATSSEIGSPAYQLMYFDNDVENTNYVRLFIWRNDLRPISIPSYLSKPKECYVVNMNKIAELGDQKLLDAYNSVMLPANFDENIALAETATRQDLAELCVSTYEKATGKKIIPENLYPFTDTKNEDDAKAYQIGVMRVYEDKAFKPRGTMMNCELVCYMYFLAQSVGISIEEGDAPVIFSDVNTTDWFYSYVLKMQNAGLLEDAFGDELNPYATANPRDAIKIAYNIYLMSCTLK
ncbi:MAG: hypothetical protein K5768_04150 [Firmicutes bacterium]|nr:hypothetical protein [Bacillota bacterium]